jgi:hypothetical protein
VLLIRYILCTLSILFTSAYIQAQVVNVDREVSDDSIIKKWQVTVAGALSSDKQKKNLLEANFNNEAIRNLRSKYMLFLIVRSDLVFNGSDLIQNEGMVHLRYRDKDTRKTSPEFFSQYQWNGIWNMKYRILAGANIRERIIEKNGIDLYAGTGIFREWEGWGEKAESKRKLWRWNNYVKASYKLSSKVDITGVSYLQFPMNSEFGKPRWYMEANAFINAGKHINIVFHWDHILDVNTVLPIDHFFYSFSTGVQINY